MRKGNHSPYMKYSAMLSPQTKNYKKPRQSQSALGRSPGRSFFQIEKQSSISGKGDNPSFTASLRLSNQVIGSKGSLEKQKKDTIQNLMKDLKINYPKQEIKNRIKRVKSQEGMVEYQANDKTDKYRASIEEIQNKIFTYKSKKHKGETSRRNTEFLSPSPMKSPTKIDLAAQKCKQLCLNLKKNVLKQTVSTTTTSLVEKTLCIKDFIIGKMLGKGKFSKVYMAQHIKSGLIVAIKIIKKQTIRRQQFDNQLSREIIIQSYFTHVNLVQLYGMFSDIKNVYLILEYCPSGQLYDIFKVKSKLKDQQWAPIMKGICQGIYSLHLNDVIHRDLKPQNILLAFGLPKIGDFGWAVYSPGDRRDTFCGTPLYISPQLLMGGNYDKQVDIWALGVMMYEYVTGRIPFKLDSNKKFVEAVSASIHYPQNLNQDCVQLLKMILNKDPQTRIAILDILEHPYLKNSLAAKSRSNNLLKSGR